MNEKEEGREENEEVGKHKKRVITMCCVGDEAIPGKIGEKVLIRLGKELRGRGNVVMTRLNDDDLKQIDALVEVEVFRSRSEAAAFFIKAGIRASKDLFQKVMPTVDKIRQLKEQARKSLNKTET